MILIQQLKKVAYTTLVVSGVKGIPGALYTIRYHATYFTVEVDYTSDIIRKHKYQIHKGTLDTAVRILRDKYYWFLQKPLNTTLKLPRESHNIPIIMRRISKPLF